MCLSFPRPGSVEHQLAVKLLDVVQQLEEDKAGRDNEEPLSRQQLSKVEKLLEQVGHPHNTTDVTPSTSDRMLHAMEGADPLLIIFASGRCTQTCGCKRCLSFS